MCNHFLFTLHHAPNSVHHRLIQIHLFIFPFPFALIPRLHSHSMATSRSESPIKQTFKKLLSPTKPKPPPVLAVQAPDLRNSSYPESTSSSNYSQDSANSSSNGGFTGWNVFERPGTPTFDANKENVNVTPKQIVNHVMGRKPSKKLRKGNTKSTSVLKNSKHDVDLDRQFEELMVQD